MKKACRRCDGSGEEPGAPCEDDGAKALCSQCGGRGVTISPVADARELILIEVSGGVAEHTLSEGSAAEVIILDWDAIESGDEPPFERPKDDAIGELAEKMREAWEKYDDGQEDNEEDES